MRKLVIASLANCVAVLGCVPHSLSAALVKNPDTFPGSYYVPLPLSSDSPLGKLPEGDVTPEMQSTRRITTQAAPCFFVAEMPPANSLSKLRIEYTASEDLKVEMKQVAVAVGASLSNSDKASFVMTDLKTIAGIGVPDLNSGCKDFFKSGGDILVFTRRIVAGSSSIDFSQNIKTQIQASGTAQTGTTISGAAGFSYGTNGTITGANLVVGAQLTKVNVKVDSVDTKLGTNPQHGRKINFPANADGNVTIMSYSNSGDTLNVLVNAPLRQQIVREGQGTCQVGQEIAVKLGQRCEFWLSSGSTLVALQWNTDTGPDGSPIVVLNMTSYSTTFTGNPGIIPNPSASIDRRGALTARR